MKPVIRSMCLTLVAVLLSLFWMDRSVYRQWIVDKPVHITPAAFVRYLDHAPMIWPRIRAWDICGHTDGDDSMYPKQSLYTVRNWSGDARDRARFARIAMKTVMWPMNDYNSDMKNQHLYDYIALMEKGEQIDPTNALYNLLRSNALLSRSMVYVDTPTKFRKSPNRKTITVTASKRFREGVRQYQLALTKQMRLYEYSIDSHDATSKPPLLLEHYETLRLKNDAAGILMTQAFSFDTIVGAAQYYIQNGDRATARRLLDIRSVAKMMLTDKQASHYRQAIVQQFGQLADPILAGIPHSSTSKTSYVNTCIEPYKSKVFWPVNFSERYQQPSGQWIGWEVINGVIQQQTVWVWQCFGLSLLIVISLIRDLVWWIVFRVKRKSVVGFVWPHQPERLALGFTVAAMILTVAQIAGLYIWADDVTGVWRVPLYVASLLLIIGWICVRFEFKRLCQLQGIQVPDRWSEMAGNWLPAAGIAGIYALSVYLSYLRIDIAGRILLLSMAGCIITAVLIPMISRKYRIQDYYILANRETRRFFAWMVVLISVGVMPIQIIYEVIMLRSDHYGTGALWSVERLQKPDRSANRVFIQRIDRYLNDNRR